MNIALYIAGLMCALLGKPAQCTLPTGPSYALAQVVVQEAARYQIDPAILAAVLRHESGFNPHARGARGEIGLGQIYRGTKASRGYDHLTDQQLEAPEVNVRLAARHLAWAQSKCGGGKPAQWVGVYAGHGCGPTKYGTRLIARLEAAQTVVRARKAHSRRRCCMTRSIDRAAIAARASCATRRPLAAEVMAARTSSGISAGSPPLAPG